MADDILLRVSCDSLGSTGFITLKCPSHTLISDVREVVLKKVQRRVTDLVGKTEDEFALLNNGSKLSADSSLASLGSPDSFNLAMTFSKLTIDPPLAQQKSPKWSSPKATPKSPKRCVSEQVAELAGDTRKAKTLANCAECRTAFSFLRRRHLCRLCDRHFCSQCASKSVTGRRACDDCWWEHHERTKAQKLVEEMEERRLQAAEQQAEGEEKEEKSGDEEKANEEEEENPLEVVTQLFPGDDEQREQDQEVVEEEEKEDEQGGNTQKEQDKQQTQDETQKQEQQAQEQQAPGQQEQAEQQFLDAGGELELEEQEELDSEQGQTPLDPEPQVQGIDQRKPEPTEGDDEDEGLCALLDDLEDDDEDEWRNARLATRANKRVTSVKGKIGNFLANFRPFSDREQGFLDPSLHSPAHKQHAHHQVVSSIQTTAVDRLFQQSGLEVGVSMWRVVGKKIQCCPEEQHQQLHCMDCFLLLCSSLDAMGKLVHSIHSWIGTRSSRSKRAVLAIKAIELKQHLGGDATHRREEQGCESEAFLETFPEMQVGEDEEDAAAEPLRKSAQAEHVMVLYRLFGDWIGQVACSALSLRQDSVYLLDAKQTVFLWIGTSSTREIQGRGTELAAKLRAWRPLDKPDLSVLTHSSADDPDEVRTFDTLLAERSKKFPQAENSTADGSGTPTPPVVAVGGSHGEPDRHLYCFRYADPNDLNSELEIEELPAAPGQLRSDTLESRNSYSLRCGLVHFVWVGKLCTSFLAECALELTLNHIEEEEEDLLLNESDDDDDNNDTAPEAKSEDANDVDDVDNEWRVVVSWEGCEHPIFKYQFVHDPGFLYRAAETAPRPMARQPRSPLLSCLGAEAVDEAVETISRLASANEGQRVGAARRRKEVRAEHASQRRAEEQRILQEQELLTTRGRTRAATGGAGITIDASVGFKSMRKSNSSSSGGSGGSNAAAAVVASGSSSALPVFCLKDWDPVVLTQEALDETAPGTADLRIFELTNSELVPVVDRCEGVFCSASVYIIFYSYVTNDDDKQFLVYCWQGTAAPVRVILAWELQLKEDVMSGLKNSTDFMPRYRLIKQDQETEHFLRIFTGMVIVHPSTPRALAALPLSSSFSPLSRGSSPGAAATTSSTSPTPSVPSSSSNAPSSPPGGWSSRGSGKQAHLDKMRGKNKIQLFRVYSKLPGTARCVEQPHATTAYLHSAGVFILASRKELMLWNGKYAGSRLRKAAVRIAAHMPDVDFARQNPKKTAKKKKTDRRLDRLSAPSHRHTKRDNDVGQCEEGQEPAYFWQLLGGKGSYAKIQGLGGDANKHEKRKWKDQRTTFAPLLFRLSARLPRDEGEHNMPPSQGESEALGHTTNATTLTNCQPYYFAWHRVQQRKQPQWELGVSLCEQVLASELNATDAFILDTFDSVFVWFDNSCSRALATATTAVAKQYAAHMAQARFPGQLDAASPPPRPSVSVCRGSLASPPLLRSLSAYFPSWPPPPPVDLHQGRGQWEQDMGLVGRVVTPEQLQVERDERAERVQAEEQATRIKRLNTPKSKSRSSSRSKTPKSKSRSSSRSKTPKSKSRSSTPKSQSRKRAERERRGRGSAKQNPPPDTTDKLVRYRQKGSNEEVVSVSHAVKVRTKPKLPSRRRGSPDTTKRNVDKPLPRWR